MINPNSIPKNLENRRVTVLGAGCSGISASLLLANKGAKVLLSDNANIAFSKKTLSKLEASGIEVELGGHTSKVNNAELVIISPGIPNTTPVVTKLESSGIPIVSELEMAYWFSKPSEIIAVTGSNGKTTTTTLIYEMFKNTQYEPYCGGNIGIPFSKLIIETEELSIKNKIFIIEVSSFQLERIVHFRPKASIILNISRDHMDRYDDIQSYFAAKMKIAKNQKKDDLFIYNSDDTLILQNLPDNCQNIPFSIYSDSQNIVNTDANSIYLYDGQKIIDRSELLLLGEHNLYNILAALTVAIKFKINIDHLRNVLKRFKGIEHRLEYIISINDVDYYNDSKATNVDSVIYALKSFQKPVIIILGGKDKDLDFSLLIPAIKSHAKEAILIGESAIKIRKVLNGIIPLHYARSLEEATISANKLSNPGEIVLLSPACASFDMFDNFEHRGKVFKETVLSLVKGKIK
ncbi:MAG: UDP-N-acetylmuramoyl-L-alanine--D-glutamate ligase [Candidatus Neomarinimicrobiota bacterium]|nr:MAG: UDP-N-acetylmuramoyl-L-alanine--D-glutamate ligase [Candidatus Neomarinimicrobiota bacterium]